MSTTTDAMKKYMVKRYGQLGTRYKPTSELCTEEDQVISPREIIIQSKMNNMQTILDPKTNPHVKEEKIDFYEMVLEERERESREKDKMFKKNNEHRLKRSSLLTETDKFRIKALNQVQILTEQIAI